MKNRGFTLMELITVMSVIGVLSAIAIPTFLGLQAKAKQSEAKSSLSSIYTLEIVYMNINDTYGDFKEIGWGMEGQARYTYKMGSNRINGIVPVADVDFQTTTTGYNSNGFTCAAAANIDGDPVSDEWSMNDDKTMILVSNDVK